MLTALGKTLRTVIPLCLEFRLVEAARLAVNRRRRSNMPPFNRRKYIAEHEEV
jgi:hypothetical protein